MPCTQPIRVVVSSANCYNPSPSCPKPPHNLSFCPGWNDRVSNGRFWISTTAADFQLPQAKENPRVLPVVPADRYGVVCRPQPSCQDPVRTVAWDESVTRFDFKSPHGAGRARRAEKLSYYQRFMNDMCTSAHILDRVAEHGTLGGSRTQYQVDFGTRLNCWDLENRHRIHIGCPPLTGNNVISPYRTCARQCNI